MDQRLSLVTLGVTDLERARRFYIDGLGWAPHPSSQDSVTFFQLPGMILALWDRASLAKDAGIQNSTDGFGGVAMAYNARSREEVDATLKEAAQAGAKILKSAEETSWGGYSGYFTDPDGHVWEVAHNPFWMIEADGSVTLPGAA